MSDAEARKRTRSRDAVEKELDTQQEEQTNSFSKGTVVSLIAPKVINLRTISYLKEHPHLTRLTLTLDGSTDGDGIGLLAAALPSWPSLTELDISTRGSRGYDGYDENISEPGIKEVIAALPQCPLLVTFRARGHFINKEDAMALIPVMRNLTNLTEVDLGWANATYEAYADGDPYDSCALAALKCPVGVTKLATVSRYGDDAKPLLDALQHCTSLTELEVRFCKWLDMYPPYMGNWGEFVPSIRHCTKLTSLRVSSMPIVESGLTASLPCFPELRRLDLRYASSDCTMELATVLPSLTNLTELNLVGVGINDDSLRVLVPALQQFTNKLKQIDIRYNEIGDEGAELLASFLRHCTTLTRFSYRPIRLHRNIGHKAESTLASVLRDLPNLTESI